MNTTDYDRFNINRFTIMNGTITITHTTSLKNSYTATLILNLYLRDGRLICKGYNGLTIYNATNLVLILNSSSVTYNSIYVMKYRSYLVISNYYGYI
jgi:hypothetical protein